MLLEDLRRKVISCAIKMADYRMVAATFGNVSARDKETNYIALTPSGMEYHKLEPEDIVITDVSGKVIEGKRKPTTETQMHTVVYRRRPEINGVVHTHSTFATALSVAGEILPIVLTETGNIIGGEVSIAPYTTPGTADLGNRALDTMGDRLAVMLKNHGVLALGDSLDAALNVALIVEETAKVYYLAKSLGKVDLVPPSEIAGLREAFLKFYGQSAN